MSNVQSVKAVAKYIRMSPHKVRRVLDQIRGRSYQEALMIIEFLPYDAGGPVWQILHSVAANAKNNYDLDKKKLIIDEVYANADWSEFKDLPAFDEGNRINAYQVYLSMEAELLEK